MPKQLEKFVNWWDEKREIVGAIAFILGWLCIFLNIQISLTQLGVVFLSCIMFIGKKYFQGVSAGPVGVRNEQ